MRLGLTLIVSTRGMTATATITTAITTAIAVIASGLVGAARIGVAISRHIVDRDRVINQILSGPGSQLQMVAAGLVHQDRVAVVDLASQQHPGQLIADLGLHQPT